MDTGDTRREPQTERHRQRQTESARVVSGAYRGVCQQIVEGDAPLGWRCHQRTRRCVSGVSVRVTAADIYICIDTERDRERQRETERETERVTIMRSVVRHRGTRWGHCRGHCVRTWCLELRKVPRYQIVQLKLPLFVQNHRHRRHERLWH